MSNDFVFTPAEATFNYRPQIDTWRCGEKKKVMKDKVSLCSLASESSERRRLFRAFKRARQWHTQSEYN